MTFRKSMPFIALSAKNWLMRREYALWYGVVLEGSKK